MKIITYNDKKQKDQSWEAWAEDGYYQSATGYGSTEEEAKRELRNKLEDELALPLAALKLLTEQP